MKILLILLVFGLSTGWVFTQDHNIANTDPPEYYHTVYQEGGTVLHGEITEWNVDFVKLRLLSDVEVVIPATKIKRIVSRKTPVRTVVVREREEKKYEFKDRGIYQAASFTVSAGPVAGIGLTHAVGYRFSRLFGLGIGSGVESFDVGSGNAIIPLFAEVRGFLLPLKLSPYYALRAGYGFASTSDETQFTESSGGRMLGAEFGYRFGAGRHVNFFAGVGFHFQDVTYKYKWPWGERFTDNIHFRRTELKLGVLF